jgi:hypothetical protein
MTKTPKFKANGTSAMMRAFAAAVEANVPVLLWGDPGVGKTSLIEAMGEGWGRHVESMSGANREATDFMGMPREDGGYTPLGWARRCVEAKRALLFLDEMTSTEPRTQKVMQRVSEERIVGETKLPEHVSIVAAANHPDVATDGWDLSAPVANRFFHLDWHFDAEAWLAGVVTDFADFQPRPLTDFVGSGDNVAKAKVKGAVTAFLKHRPELLAPGPPKDEVSAGRAWPSPRSWTKAMKVLSYLKPNDADAALLVIKGCVGEGAATEYLAWEATADLADPVAVMNDPSLIDWAGERPDRLFALLGSVTALVRMNLIGGKADKTSWEKGMAVLTACAAGGKPDAAIPSARVLVNLRPGDGDLTSAHREAFAPLLTRMGRFAEPAPTLAAAA